MSWNRLWLVTFLFLGYCGNSSAIDWPVFPDSEVHRVGNSYGEYQYYEGGGDPFMHTGVDIMVHEGTPVYAVKAGYVKAIMTPSANTHWRVVIGDSAGAPECDGWMYAHLIKQSITGDAGLTIGQWVEEGQFLGYVVDFPLDEYPEIDFDHIHFSKVRGSGFIWGSFATWEYIANPLDEIDHPQDSEAPVFEDALDGQIFGICRNGVPLYFEIGQTLYGEVDIISRIYDRINHPDWKLAPYRIEYRIEGETSTDWINSVCFTGSIGTYGSDIQQAVNIVYESDQTCESHSDYVDRIYFFNVTNTDGDSIIEATDEPYSWSTADFQNGEYTIYIRAHDCGGNSTVASMTVQIENYFTLGGTITLDDGGRDMSGTIVTILSSGQSDTTDAAGDFFFASVGGGHHAVTIRHDGYWPEDSLILMNTNRNIELTMQSIDFICGDANGDDTLTADDIAFLHNYLFDGGAAPTPFDAGNADACGTINISDIAFLAQFLYSSGPKPCEPYMECEHPAGENQIILGCPLEVLYPNGDSVALPILITNDIDLAGLTLGFHHNSDDVEISSVDLAGSVLNGIFDNYTAEIITETKAVFLYGYGIDTDLAPQSGGLLATIWLQIPAETPDQTVDFDTFFVAPGAGFIFAPSAGGIVSPVFADCGTSDIIISSPFIYTCGDANRDDVVNVADAVFLINYVFKDGPAPDPLCVGDANDDGLANVADAVYLINYVFKDGEPPVEPCCQ